jgi:hypothetical protein
LLIILIKQIIGFYKAAVISRNGICTSSRVYAQCKRKQIGMSIYNLSMLIRFFSLRYDYIIFDG